MTAKEAIVAAEKISKSFSGIQVLRDVDFEIRPGEVHALVGENGAGKSTLTKIICGVYESDRGRVMVNGKQERISSPLAARSLGIALIHQEPLIFQDLDVAKNIFAGHTRNGPGLTVDWKNIYRESQELLESLGVSLDPKAKMKGMSIADQQMVEIISALSQDARVIIMDEPTAALTPGEVGTLFEIIRRLVDQDKAIVFISHRIDEVLDISDRVTVLRDGEKVGTNLTGNLDQEQIIRMMIGREIKELITKETVKIDDVIMQIDNISLAGDFKNISFELRKGEILGFAGLVGAGRSEVSRAIFGITPPESGSISIKGRNVNIRSPKDAIKHGVAYVPEDRQHQGLFLPFGIASNMTLAIPERITNRGWIKSQAEKEITEDYVGRLNIRVRSIRQLAAELSGGNQQKVVLSKWLLTDPQILLLDEPTRGIDVGAKGEVYKIINRLAGEGIAILLISSELPEILTLSDRIVVMKEGRITGHFTKAQATEDKIMAAAAVSLNPD
ncbi:MAG: sugar ABC transporter ATP-binding protein [Desulfobacterales bacterium]|jgi:ABC-type sugar transport system ATPase subunit